MKSPKENIENRPAKNQQAINTVFARFERMGARIGLGLIIFGLAVYLSGLIPPLLAIEDLVAEWGFGVGEFISRTGQPNGWDWIYYLGHGDMLGLLGLAVLAGVIIISYAAILPVLLKQKDLVYSVLVILQIAVFILAAGGWLTSH